MGRRMTSVVLCAMFVFVLFSNLVLITEEVEAATTVSVAVTGATHESIVICWTKTGDWTFIRYEVYAKREIDGLYGEPCYTTTDPDDTFVAVTQFKDWTGSLILISPDKNYNFIVRDVDSFGYADSAEILATSTSSPSISLTSSSSSIIVSWTNPFYYLGVYDYWYHHYEYDVYRSTDFGPWELMTTIYDISTTSWEDTSVSSGVEYTYYVKILNELMKESTWVMRDSHYTSTVSGTTTEIDVTNPKGGEIWKIGNPYTITWNSTGYVDYVKIDLYKGGSYFSTITSSTSEDGSYTWTIPSDHTEGTNFQIKITSTSDSNVYDYSDGYFTIEERYLVVSTPNGGENWEPGNTYTIDWYSKGTIPYVKIELYKGDSYYSTITSSTSNTESYSWGIPLSHTWDSDYQIKIISTSDSTVYDYSDNYFTIEGVIITVSTPNGGEIWEVGKTYMIYWSNTGIVNYVKIDLYKGNNYYSTITSSTSNDGSHSWSIPTSQSVGENYRIKITSTSDNSKYDYSDDYFTIEDINLTITSPNGGENWEPGKTYSITWESEGTIDYVKIELYKGGSYYSTITSSTSNDWSYSWSIPKSLSEGTNYKIKISSTSDNSVSDLSDNSFTIEIIKKITVSFPNGGENWDPGKTYSITWESEGTIDYVKIELYKDGTFFSTITSSTSNDWSYSWSIPSSLSFGTDYKIKITSTSDSAVYDYTDNYFTIGSITLIVNSPNGGEEWETGQTYTITWGSEGTIDYVKIELYKGGTFFSTITSSTSNDWSYSWSIPKSLSEGTNYKIKISSTSDNSVSDLSDNSFTIEIIKKITVSFPNGGEIWEPGNTYTISWNSEGTIDYVKIELYKGGTFYSTLTSSLTNDGSYSWNISPSQTEGTDYKIKITSTSDSDVYGESSNFFSVSIGKYIQVTAPNGGDNWVPENSYVIRWDSNAGGYVKIDLYKENSYDHTISTSTSNDGNYNWSIPLELDESSIYRIRITLTSDSSLTDFSDEYFSVSADDYIWVTTPNGGEQWKPGTSHYIYWESNADGYVKIELFNSGSYYTTIISNINNVGSYYWNVPEGINEGEFYRIKITSTSDSTLNDSSDNFFSIVENVTDAIIIISPNGGETWEPGATYTITWDLTGAKGYYVKIELFAENSQYHTITSSTASDSRSYDWTVPSDLALGANYRIKITSTSDEKLFDWSDDYFTIESQELIVVTYPNAWEELKLGTTYTISWQSSGSFNYVMIELYKDGRYYSTITSRTSNDGSYLWKIPSDHVEGVRYKIKITSLSDSNVYDYSNTYFSIDSGSKNSLGILGIIFPALVVGMVIIIVVALISLLAMRRRLNQQAMSSLQFIEQPTRRTSELPPPPPHWFKTPPSQEPAPEDIAAFFESMPTR